MPFDGSGTFNRVMNWVNDAASGLKIRADRHDSEDNNLAAGLTMCLTKDGQTTPTADIKLGGKKLINVADPVNDQDAATKAWVNANIIGGALIADAPPAAGKVGNLWWDSDQGNLYLRYDDGTSVQWVQVNVASPAQPIIDSGVFKISSGVISTPQATLDIAFPAGYIAYQLALLNCGPVNNATGLVLRFSNDGVTFDAAGNYADGGNVSQFSSTPGNIAQGHSGASGITVLGQVGNAPTVPASVYFDFQAQQQGIVPFVTWRGAYYNGSLYYNTVGSGYNGALGGKLAAVRFLFGTGNIATATWQLNGIK